MSDNWQTTFYGLLPNAGHTKFWVTGQYSRPELPTLNQPGENFWHPVAWVEENFSGSLGIPVRVLYRAFYHKEEVSRHVHSLFVLEPQPAIRQPTSPGRWEDTIDLSLPDIVQAAIQGCLDEWANGSSPPFRPPWSRPGWYDTMWSWVEQELGRLGFTITGRATTVRSWALSFVLRIPTDLGLVYMKAGADQPLFANEGSILQYLANHYPYHVPVPLAVDAQCRWMLLPDVGEAIGWDATLETQLGMLATYAAMQKDASGRVDALLANGCIDRRLDHLVEHIDYLLDHPAMAQALTGEELARLRELAPRLRADCALLATYGVPPTLGHGDLHGGNVARPDEHFIIYDWTDACIMHPFIDMINIHYYENETERSQLVDHYLAQWAGFDTPGRLREAWQLAQPLMSLHQAVSYQMLVDHVEPASRIDLDWGPPYWLRQVLKAYSF